ncbi:MAG: CxxxxCH/CxxCH domain-containing protein, partial [candidate division KSB1 bacterium]|nr:CxxxxCH/CxxCH domain-containing protein [candidate division KSB1 bacterium]
CRKCHGQDYAGGTSNSSCNTCHSGTPEACTTCHGGLDNSTGAPPKDIDDHTEIRFRGVGAHLAHVSNSRWGGVFDCDACHIKPAQFETIGHADSDLPAEIIWGELPRTGGLSPTWDGSICTNVYCHGASLSNGTQINPVWTQAEALTCDACHGLPPKTGAHQAHIEPYQFQCNICHDGYFKNTAVNQLVHIDGKKDVQLITAVGGNYANEVCSNVICHGSRNSPAWTEAGDFNCTSCHGGLDNNTGAPPFDLSRNSLTTARGVGAHTVHVMGGTLSDGMDCTECHAKPEKIDDPGHIGPDLLPAEITWGKLAQQDGATPSWDGVQTCQNVYCHGEFRSGNKENNPSWIVVDGSQAVCGSCHGLPPGSPHPAVSQCSRCHTKVVDASNNIIGKDKHINGRTDF